jgi:hypothetical protein
MQMADGLEFVAKASTVGHVFSNGGACVLEPFEWIAVIILREGMDKGQIKPYPAQIHRYYD